MATEDSLGVPAASLTPPAELERILHSDHADPFQILGMHEIATEAGPRWVVRAFLREAVECAVVDPRDAKCCFPLQRIHPDGFFEGLLPNCQAWFPYRLRLTNAAGHTWEIEDPYRFPPVVREEDLYLFAEGTCYRAYRFMGAHERTVEGVAGVLFVVWAPNARRVSVIGDFNGWDGRWHPMRSRMSSGLWELFLPGLQPGERYKFEIKTPAGHLLVKSDPYGYASERRPHTASLVCNLEQYSWHDADWLEARREGPAIDRPLSIYEVHLGSWRRVPEQDNRPLTYRELADTLIPYVKDLGFTHLELLPLAEHPLDQSWGYQITGYYAVTSRYGWPTDFMEFVDRCHVEGLGVLLDWVPAHFPRDAHGLAEFDGTCLYEHADPRRGAHPDWGTLVFNYGRWEVRNFLISNALFWLDHYHIDGLRADAVASMLYLDYSRRPGEWVPNIYGGNENLEAIHFLHRLNEIVHQEYPGVLMIAEESTAWPGVSHPVYLGGLGFDFKWNMGWMHDILRYMSTDPLFRKYHHNLITFGLLYAFFENFILVLSHDEVVHGKRSLLDKMPGDPWQKFANLRLLYGFMYGHPGKKHLFMGGEFAQGREWSEESSLDWPLLEYESHRGVQCLVRDLNHLYRSEASLYEVDTRPEGFEWIDFSDTDNVTVSFLRRARDPSDFLVFVANMTPVPRTAYRIGVPQGGFYEEKLNTDAREYGGSGWGNFGGVWAEPVASHGRPYSLNLTLPPLAVLVLKPAWQD